MMRRVLGKRTAEKIASIVNMKQAGVRRYIFDLKRSSHTIISILSKGEIIGGALVITIRLMIRVSNGNQNRDHGLT